MMVSVTDEPISLFDAPEPAGIVHPRDMGREN
jgi:hypothetical protein